MNATGRRVLVLVHPETGFWDSLRSAPSLPLNLLHAASLVAPRFDVRVVDLRVDPGWRRTLTRLCALDPVLVGVTSMLGHSARSAVEVARFVKSIAACPVVFGGPLPTLVAETAALEEAVDHVLRGEGETSLLALAEALAEGRSPGDVPGLVSPGRTSGLPAAIDLDTAPELPYHLVDVRRYFQVYGDAQRYLPMETSRGCDCGCLYCHNSGEASRGWRAQSAERVLERAARLQAGFGVDGIYFVDDNFFQDKRRALAIAAGLGRLGLKWQIQGIDIGRLNRLTHDELQALADSGLKRITVGIESGSDAIRGMVNKKLRADQVVGAIARLARYPIIVYCSFIVNFPGETRADVRQTSDLIAALVAANPNFRNSPVYQYVPIPGTATARQAEQLGYRPPATYEGWGDISFERGCGIDTAGFGPGFYRALYFITLFNDNKYNEYGDSRLFKWLASTYRPLALLRLRRFLIVPVPEARVFFWVKALARKVGSMRAGEGSRE